MTNSSVPQMGCLLCCRAARGRPPDTGGRGLELWRWQQEQMLGTIMRAVRNICSNLVMMAHSKVDSFVEARALECSVRSPSHAKKTPNSPDDEREAWQARANATVEVAGPAAPGESDRQQEPANQLCWKVKPRTLSAEPSGCKRDLSPWNLCIRTVFPI